MTKCTLCSSSKSDLYSFIDGVNYFKCRNCSLIFQTEESLLDPLDEKKRYDAHENNPEDPGYRRFLSRLVDPIIERIIKGDLGLDYGCGPGPTISIMMKEKGFTVENYDLYYTPNFKPKGLYQFITSSEAFEHFYSPKSELENILSLLDSGGILGIMTLLSPKSKDEFDKWWYKNDPTHVCFFSEETFKWIGQEYGLEVDILSEQVIILKKK